MAGSLSGVGSSVRCMDGWGDAEARTWLAMDLLAPVHDLWALAVVPGSGGEAPPAVQALTEGLLGEHRSELTGAALAGLVDLERALVVGAALDLAGGLVEPEVLVLVECALVDEACRLSLLPLVNAAADLLVELERDAGEHDAEPNDAEPTPAAGDADAAPTRGDATDDDGPGELRAVVPTSDPEGSISPGGVRIDACPLSEDIVQEPRSSHPSERVATPRGAARRRVVVRHTKRAARARPGAGRANRRDSRGRSRGPPGQYVSLPHGERRAHDARPGGRQVAPGHEPRHELRQLSPGVVPDLVATAACPQWV